MSNFLFQFFINAFLKSWKNLLLKPIFKNDNNSTLQNYRYLLLSKEVFMTTIV